MSKNSLIYIYLSWFLSLQAGFDLKHKFFDKMDQLCIKVAQVILDSEEPFQIKTPISVPILHYARAVSAQETVTLSAYCDPVDCAECYNSQARLYSIFACQKKGKQSSGHRFCANCCSDFVFANLMAENVICPLCKSNICLDRLQDICQDLAAKNQQESCDYKNLFNLKSLFLFDGLLKKELSSLIKFSIAVEGGILTELGFEGFTQALVLRKIQDRIARFAHHFSTIATVDFFFANATASLIDYSVEALFDHFNFSLQETEKYYVLREWAQELVVGITRKRLAAFPAE